MGKLFSFKILFSFILLALLVSAGLSTVKKETASVRSKIIFPHIVIQPEKIVPGDPVLITIEATSTPIEILWNDKKISHFIYDGRVSALVPIDFNEKILEHIVTAKLENGEVLTKKVAVAPREKIEKPLGIPEKLGGNTPAAATNLVNNLAVENKILNTVKTATTTLWTKVFDYPVKNVFVTDEYGYDRNTVNQTIVHKGTDFRAQVGTEVVAMNDGIIRIARKFTVYGNSVVIDHGLGVQTLYMHLSKLNVKEGDRVKRGQVIGLSGDTGYVEAPHLHISVKINSISIDPETFLGFFVKPAGK